MWNKVSLVTTQLLKTYNWKSYRHIKLIVFGKKCQCCWPYWISKSIFKINKMPNVFFS